MCGRQDSRRGRRSPGLRHGRSLGGPTHNPDRSCGGTSDGPDQAHHTYAEYCRWGNDACWELMDGVAFATAPASARRHQEVLGELFRQVANSLQSQPCRVFIAPFDVRLPRAGEADDAVDTVAQPDPSVVCDPPRLDQRGSRGAPDWVAEVLSPATVGHDHVVKRAGVREYWLAQIEIDWKPIAALTAD